MRRSGKAATIVICLSTTMILCGWLFQKKEFILDTENRILYQNSSVEQILSDIEKNGDMAKEKYDDSYCAVSGKITGISKNGKAFVIGEVGDHAERFITCTPVDKALAGEVEKRKVGESVRVYGKVKVTSFHDDVSMEMEQIVSAEETTVSEAMYSDINGKAYDTSDMIPRELADGKITYYIPQKWAAVEYNIVENKLGSIEGYQYVLNEIPGELAVEPESIFVCYFDSKTKLKDRSQKSEKKKIRALIIDNILKTDQAKTEEIKKQTSYYGTDYFYYAGSYTDKQKQGHYVEFVFQEDGTDGMLVYLYVYQKENTDHIDDILSVMRCLEIE